MEVAASAIAIIQITTQIATCVVKTKKLWGQAQEFPEDVQALVMRLQCLHTIFDAMEQQLNDDSLCSVQSNALVRTNLDCCQKSLRTLQTTADDLLSQLNTKKGLKRKLATVKMTIGNDGLDRLKNRLNESIEILKLSITAWNMVVSSRSRDAIISGVATHVRTHIQVAQPLPRIAIELRDEDSRRFQDEPIKENQLAKTTRKYEGSKQTQNKAARKNQLATAPQSDPKLVKTYSRSRLGRFALAYTATTGAWQAYIQWPSWLSQSALEIQSSPTICGWMYNYRMYNIISSESQIIQKISDGDKAGVLELFDSRQASPFDKDESGQSLLYYAANSKSFELCELFLSLGLKDALVERVGESKRSAIEPLVFMPNRHNPEVGWMKIVELFLSYLDDSESSMILQFFDYQRDCDYRDDYANIFRQRFLPNIYTGPLRSRLEAFRLGSFHSQATNTLLQLLTQNEQVTNLDVSSSTHEKLSLVHSVALALGIRFADEALPHKRGWAMWRTTCYDEDWSILVQQVSAVAEPEDLHSIETVQPWDAYHVPFWRGTPLVSVIGGALCYLSPDISFVHWDTVFQKSIRQWVLDLQESEVDLVAYGQQEAAMLKEQMRGALDANAIESSRNCIREFLPKAAIGLTTKRTRRTDRDGWNQNHWVPIRLLELKTGPVPGDWRVIWAPEFEWMACQFWEMAEKEDIVMPGSWVD